VEEIIEVGVEVIDNVMGDTAVPPGLRKVGTPDG
jgi:uncharacterized protein (UPF0147 family)